MTSLKQINVVICGYYGQGNGGDEALLLTVLGMLPPGVTPIVLSAKPEITGLAYQVQTINRYDLAQIITVLRSAHWFMWGGGSLIQDSSSWRNPIFYCGLMLIAQCLGVKTLAWAQGVGPLNTSLGQFLARQAFRGCDRVSVRDQGSAELLQSWGIKPLVGPDPVWNLEAAAPGNVVIDPTTIAVTLRPHQLLTLAKLELLIESLVHLYQNLQCPLLLLPFHRGEDDRLAEAIAQRMEDHNTPIKMLKIDDPRQLKAVFSQVKLLIGMRLHSLIMAASMGCNSWALSYDPKVTQLMEQIGLPGWHLRDLPSEPEAIALAWQQSYQGPPLLDLPQIKLIQAQVQSTHQALLKELSP